MKVYFDSNTGTLVIGEFERIISIGSLSLQFQESDTKVLIFNGAEKILEKTTIVSLEDSTGTAYTDKAGLIAGLSGFNVMKSVSTLGSDNTDGATNSILTVSYAHHEIHEGDHYNSRTFVTIAKAGTYDLLISTPDTDKFGHFVLQLEAISSKITAWLYRAVTTTADGTAVTVENRNHNSTNINGIEIFHTPTLDVLGTDIPAKYIIGSGKNIGGAARDNEEIVLMRNTKYLLRITEANILATEVNINLDWYEHTAKNVILGD